LSVSGLVFKSRKRQGGHCWFILQLHGAQKIQSLDRFHYIANIIMLTVIIQTGIFASHMHCSKAAFVQYICHCSTVAVAGNNFNPIEWGCTHNITSTD